MGWSLDATCEGCGEPFTVTDYHFNRQRFCTSQCGAAFRWRTRRRDHPGLGAEPMARSCACGRPIGPRAPRCRTCYNRDVYRAKPDARARHRRAVIEYGQRVPEKRWLWARRWRQRVGLWVPDLNTLRHAISAVEDATQRARVRGAGELGRDDDLEW